MRVDRTDLWILGLVLPLAVAALALHVREVVRTGLAQPPVFASPGPGPDALPFVGGFTQEVDSSGTELRPGDRLLAVGEHDLRGRGYLGFMGLAFEAADDDLRVPVRYERDGQPGETSMRLRAFAVPWLRVPFLVGMLAILVPILLQRPGDPFARLGVLAMASMAIGESIFEGGSLTQTAVAKLLFIFGGGVWMPLIFLWLMRFPGGPVPEPLCPWARPTAAAVGLLWVGTKSMYLLGGPVPPQAIPAVVSAVDALSVVLIMSIAVWNYRHLDEGGRRRIRWCFYTTWMAAVPMIVALATPVVAPDFPGFSQLLGFAGVASVLIPIGFFVAIVGYELFDIDRLISATASYSLLVAGLLGAILAVAPGVAEWAARVFDVDAQTSQLALSVALGAAVIPVGQFLQPRVDRWLFPERYRIEEGIESLLADQAAESRAEPLAERVAEGLHALFGARGASVYVRGANGMHAVLRRAEGASQAPEVLPLEHALVERLARQHSPLLLEAEDPVAQEQLGAVLFLPIRRRDALEAIVALGRKRSGDIYTPGELALLTALVETASRQLELAEEAEAHARERLRAEALDRLRREAENVNLTRSRHLAAASHDLRQPLHALGLFAEALIERAESDEIRGLAERIDTSAGALHEMFDALIDLSRLDQGTLVTTPTELDARSLLERLAAEAEPLARAKGLELRVSCAEPALVHSDPILLGRILRNLLSNAIRYTRLGHVTLRAEPRDGTLLVSVEDSGPGIAQADREAIFEEFVRLEPGAERGLGLGLAIVRRLCDLLGHRLEVDSEPGVGSRFTVEVPQSVAPTARAQPEVATAAPAFAGLEILLVDDDLDVLDGMSALLQSWGVNVRVATDLDEALQVSEGHDVPLDLVVADYRLRDELCGTTVIEQVRARSGRELPALVITGSSSAEVTEDLRSRGLPRLSKPVRPARLRAALHALVRG